MPVGEIEPLVTDWFCQKPSGVYQSVTILVLYANRTDRSSTRHKLIHSSNFIRINQIYWGTSGNTTQAKFTTMFLTTIFNPFLTRELRTTGFEGVATEICLIQRANKTDRQHACKTEYLVMPHGREDSVKSTNVARNKRMSTDSSPQLERPAWQNGAPYSLFSRHRVRTPSPARSGPAQC